MNEMLSHHLLVKGLVVIHYILDIAQVFVRDSIEPAAIVFLQY
jgi:hypothetical protein